MHRRAHNVFGVRAVVVAFLLGLALALLQAPAHAKHHSGVASHRGEHAQKSTESASYADPNELLPAVCVNGETMTRAQHQKNLDSFKHCKYQRSDAIAIFNRGFDINGDGGLDKHECNLARNYYLTSLERVFVEDCDTVFKHCDCDGDGLVTIEDLVRAEFTCIRDCKTATIIADYISNRMKGDAFEGKQ